MVEIIYRTVPEHVSVSILEDFLKVSLNKFLNESLEDFKRSGRCITGTATDLSKKFL